MTALQDEICAKIRNLSDDKAECILRLINDLEPLLNGTKTANATVKPHKANRAWGALSQYANPQLWSREQDAWAEAVAEKYGLS